MNVLIGTADFGESYACNNSKSSKEQTFSGLDFKLKSALFAG